MKQIEFVLERPVRLVPMRGESDVIIRTTGDVLVHDCSPSEHRLKSITLTETQRASLKRSPMGLYQTVKIRLPLNEASEHEFHRQLTMLFDNVMIDNV